MEDFENPESFDRANYYRILSRLLTKGIPKSVIRLLLSWYEATNIHVMFNNSLSHNSFGINHSVRQGGLLSPVLFTAGLLDDLLAELELSGIGCRINFKYFGVVAYADDIVLMAPTIQGLNCQLNISSRWAQDNYLEFSPSKSFVICFSDKRNKWPSDTPIPAFLNGNLIPTTTEILHLGHILTQDLDDSSELIRVSKSFNKQFHAFHCRFVGINNFQLLKHIFNSFCTSFYGLEAVDPKHVSATSIRFFRKSVNIALMKMLRLPRESVSPHLIAEGIMNAESVWKFRSVIFWKSLIQSRHPMRDFLLTSHSDMIFHMTRQLKLLPLSLPMISKSAIQNIIITDWMASKDLI